MRVCKVFQKVSKCAKACKSILSFKSYWDQLSEELFFTSQKNANGFLVETLMLKIPLYIVYSVYTVYMLYTLYKVYNRHRVP